MDEITLKALAKINLGLDVVRRNLSWQQQRALPQQQNVLFS